MRLRIQVCFILWLCFFSGPSSAAVYQTVDLAWAACQARLATTTYEYAACFHFPEPKTVKFANQSWNPNGAGVNYSYTTGCPADKPFDTSTGTCSEPPPPPCDAPNYIDSMGECVPPQEICFTEIASMADQCVYIGTDDPTAPEGCVVDAVTGAQICLSEDPGCYVADGKTICPTPGMVCGTKNGTFSCVAPEQEGCGYFNGERVCFAPDGQKVDNTSPDHPDNGGNLDGDETNDPKDPRPVDQGGDSENQVDNGKGNATEKTSLNQLNEQKNINKNLKSIDNSIKNLSSSLTQDVGSGELSSIENSVKNPLEPGSDLSVAFDSHIDAIDTNKADVGVDMVQGIGTKVTGLVSQGACSELSYTSALTSFSLGCEKTKKIRDLLSWVLYLLTVWVCFNVITEPTTRRG